LGPASQRFVDRVIDNHIKKNPDKLTDADLPKLANWVKVSLALLTDDKALIDKCEKKLLALRFKNS
jgi:hypothetical protein